MSRIVASLMMLLLAMIPLAASAVNADHTLKPPRNFDVAFDVDVVAGGSTGAVAAACEAAQQGAGVFPAAPRPYLGTDSCATLRLWLDENEAPKSKRAIACFGQDRRRRLWSWPEGSQPAS